MTSYDDIIEKSITERRYRLKNNLSRIIIIKNLLYIKSITINVIKMDIGLISLLQSAFNRYGGGVESNSLRIFTHNLGGVPKSKTSYELRKKLESLFENNITEISNSLKYINSIKNDDDIVNLIMDKHLQIHEDDASLYVKLSKSGNSLLKNDKVPLEKRQKILRVQGKLKDLHIKPNLVTSTYKNIWNTAIKKLFKHYIDENNVETPIMQNLEWQ